MLRKAETTSVGASVSCVGWGLAKKSVTHSVQAEVGPGRAGQCHVPDLQACLLFLLSLHTPPAAALPSCPRLSRRNFPLFQMFMFVMSCN